MRREFTGPTRVMEGNKGFAQIVIQNSLDLEKPCVGRRYNLHPHGEGILLSGSDHGLDQPDGSGMAAIQHAGQLVLCGCSGRSERLRKVKKEGRK